MPSNARFHPHVCDPLPRSLVKVLAVFVILAPLAAMSAPQEAATQPALEVIDSSRVHLSAVHIHERDGVLTLRGRASRLIARRGLIPGAVKVTLLDAQGQILASTIAKPMRPNHQSRFADFFVQLKESDFAAPDIAEPFAGTRVQVAAVPASR
ncbi:hypothetical protein [Thiorhodovibrio frisius]|uniref:Uncharacterized protein n=1 Tax=Thiorhodovibrio frisius TaxID=631362 RepID=H8Z364_9GAMM|nr:hypothetical protein [Thiorhodovibrio frisius]EIC21772.1 hypothetical protein Thi970DRAFT_02001 [Thiorhodovibrio frisius]WPL21738.1 hypothetical protein Thiofri_01871 [Thiorhodovibrio frisius]